MSAFAGRLINQLVALALVISSFPATAKRTELPVVLEIGQAPETQDLQQPGIREATPGTIEIGLSDNTSMAAAAMDNQPPSLSLRSTRSYLLPDTEIILSWELTNWMDSLEGLSLAWELAPGFLPMEVKEGFDPGTGRLVTPLLGLSGELRLASPQTLPSKASFSLRLLQKDTPVLETQLSLEPLSLQDISATGGLALSPDSRVKVQFPPSAGMLQVSVVSPHPQELPYTLSGEPFEVLAFAADGSSDLVETSQFTQPLTISVSYDPEQIKGDPSTLRLFFFDEINQNWQPLLSQVDLAAHTVQAQSSHLTIFDIDVRDWEAARLPLLSNAQTAPYSGAATYAYPLQLPAGPGGLQPSLALSYNSQAVDSASSQTQASWVGMGWNLEVGYIQRDMHGTPDYVNDDSFYLVMDGAGGLLLPIADQDGDGDTAPEHMPYTVDWRLENDNFWRIRQYVAFYLPDLSSYWYDVSTWKIWDQQGNVYTFTAQAHYPKYSACSAPFMTTWRWPLAQVTNLHGQNLTYTYTFDYSTKTHPSCSGQYNAFMEVAVYPQYIIYPNGRYRVEFPFSATPRRDLLDSWDSVDQYVLYQTKLLDRIDVWHDPDGVWVNGNEGLVRRYQLGLSNGPIFPGLAAPTRRSWIYAIAGNHHRIRPERLGQPAGNQLWL